MSILGIFKRWFQKDVPSFHLSSAPVYPFSLSSDYISSVFEGCTDFVVRSVSFPDSFCCPICWLDGLTSGKDISDLVIRPLRDLLSSVDIPVPDALFAAAQNGAVWACTVHSRSSADDVIRDLTSGCCAVFFDSLRRALTFEVKSSSVRSISPPTVEKTVKGGKDAFVEALRVNTTLVRRRLRTPSLKVEQQTVGRQSGTAVALLYLDGIVNPDTLSLVQQRLSSLDIDGLTAAGQLEQYLTDHPHSLFPRLIHTERPDSFAAELLNGRIGLFADGIPIGFLLPATLSDFMRVPEDRAQHPLLASCLMLLRRFSAFLSALFPALLVAVSMYHQEMIPTKLLLSMIEAKQQVPFSEAVEVLAMLLAFELLMEAGIRLPDPVGDTVSIIGALIVGQSAVEARIVSPITVIVIATSAICGFTQPSRDLGGALRILRFCFVLLAVFFGFFGIALGITLLVWYLASMDCFGVPYTAPLSEGGIRTVLRGLLRLPLSSDKLRPAAMRTTDRRNQK